MLMTLGNLLLVALLQLLSSSGPPELEQGRYGAVVNQPLDPIRARDPVGATGLQTPADDSGVSPGPDAAAASPGSAPSLAAGDSGSGEQDLSPYLQERLDSLIWSSFVGLLIGILVGTALSQWRLLKQDTENSFLAAIFSYILLLSIAVIPSAATSKPEIRFLTCGIAIIGWSNMHSRMMKLKVGPHIASNIVMLIAFGSCLYLYNIIFATAPGFGRNLRDNINIIEKDFNLIIPLVGAAMAQFLIIHIFREVHFKNGGIIDQHETWLSRARNNENVEKSEYGGGSWR